MNEILSDEKVHSHIDYVCGQICELRSEPRYRTQSRQGRLGSHRHRNIPVANVERIHEACIILLNGIR